MPVRGNDLSKELEELRGEERVARELLETERPPLRHLDLLEADVEELLQ
jgi:hypothetical protein